MGRLCCLGRLGRLGRRGCLDRCAPDDIRLDRIACLDPDDLRLGLLDRLVVAARVRT